VTVQPPETTTPRSSELQDQAVTGAAPPERRRAERRRQVLRGLLLGSFRARRRQPRRAGEQALAAVDWHHPQWLATAILILVFSGADALLTLELIEHGAYETNPLMRPLLAGSALAFTLVKVGLTAGGVVLLTLLARMRLFGRLSAGLLLYALLALYGALIFYEFSLIDLR
jgi:hypothetical protein